MNEYSKKYTLQIRSFINEECLEHYGKDMHTLILSEIKELFSSLTFKSKRIGDIKVSMDWESFYTYFEKVYDARQEYISLETPEQVGEFFSKKFDKSIYSFNLDCNMSSKSSVNEIEEATNRYFKYHLNNFLYKLFIVLNLSIPGYFSFNNLKVLDDDEKIVDFKAYSSEFFRAYNLSKENNWPYIRRLPISSVLKWYDSLNIDYRQIAKTSTERTIFAVIHSCKSFDFDVSSFIWLAHALESLYDTPNITISKILKDRIFLFLGKGKENQTYLKKQVEKFYKIRSGFVHGDFDISHPSCNEILDEALDDYLYDLMDPYSFAFSIIVASLQKMILNNWKEIRFFEDFEGIVGEQ